MEKGAGFDIMAHAAPTIAAIAAFIAALRSHGETKEVKSALNQKLDQLIEEVRKAAFTAGEAAEKQRASRRH